MVGLASSSWRKKGNWRSPGWAFLIQHEEQEHLLMVPDTPHIMESSLQTHSYLVTFALMSCPTTLLEQILLPFKSHIKDHCCPQTFPEVSGGPLPAPTRPRLYHSTYDQVSFSTTLLGSAPRRPLVKMFVPLTARTHLAQMAG